MRLRSIHEVQYKNVSTVMDRASSAGPYRSGSILSLDELEGRPPIPPDSAGTPQPATPGPGPGTGRDPLAASGEGGADGSEGELTPVAGPPRAVRPVGPVRRTRFGRPA